MEVAGDQRHLVDGPLRIDRHAGELRRNASPAARHRQVAREPAAARWSSELGRRAHHDRGELVQATDGRDEDNAGTGPGSLRTQDDVFAALAQTDAVIYPIGLGPRVDRALLERLAVKGAMEYRLLVGRKRG